MTSKGHTDFLRLVVKTIYLQKFNKTYLMLVAVLAPGSCFPYLSCIWASWLSSLPVNHWKQWHLFWFSSIYFANILLKNTSPQNTQLPFSFIDVLNFSQRYMKYFCRLQLLSCNIDTVHVYCVRVTDNALRSTERIR